MGKSFSRISKIMAVLTVLVLAMSVAVAPAYAKAKTSSVSSKQYMASKFTIFNNSPYSLGFMDGRYSDYDFGPFQNFCVTPDKKHIFAMNIGKKKSGPYKGIKNNTGLICYRLNGEHAEFRDGVVLDYYGHSDVLAITQPDLSVERYYVWVAKSKVKKAKKTEQTYGKIIERLTFSFNDASDSATVSDRIEITDFAKANVVKKGKKRVAKAFPQGAIERVSVAANQGDNRIAFRLRFKKGGASFVIYDLNQLSQALDNALMSGKSKYSIKSAKNFQLANLSCTLTPCTEYLDKAECGFQSFDVDRKNLYICGHTRWKRAKYKAGVYVVPYKNAVGEQNKNSMKSVKQNIRIATVSEIEGLKVESLGKKHIYYFNTIPEVAGMLRFDQRVYKVVR